MRSRASAEKVSAVVAVLTLLAVSMVFASPACAQVSGATLTGTVKDSSGAVIPNAQVAITDVATGVTRTVSSGSAGLYTAPNLLPGTYEIRVTATGFSTQLQKGITLTVGAQQVLDFTMQVGQVTQTVEVTTEAPTVELTSSTISAMVNATTVRELPLNGRSWTDLATLQPGVNAVRNVLDFTTSGRGNRGFGQQLTISGARPQQNNYRLDGVSLNDQSNGGPGSVLGGNLGVDAIQEFSVLTSNYTAEYGKTAGGVVNAITRSGTNQLHGDVYEFLRNSALDARNFFDRGKIPGFRRNQFGGSAGGPIHKDRTFIFGDYEAIRQSKGIAFTDTVPSAAARAGNLSTGPVIPDASATKYLALYPLPNGPLLGAGDIGIFSFAAQQVVSENFFTIRGDHKISDKDSLFVTYMYDYTHYTSPDSLDDQSLGSHTDRNFAVLEENHIFSPTFINTVRVGYNRDYTANNKTVSAINPLAGDASLGAFPGRFAARVLITGVTTFIGGLDGGSAFVYAWNSFQAYDDASVTRGHHSLRFGGGVERMDLNSSAFNIPNGIFTFGPLANFLLNRPSRFEGILGNIQPPSGVRQSLFGAYVQDDWRWRPNLTLNLGLRYEMTTVPTEVQGKQSNLVHFTDSTAHLGAPIFQNPTLRNFEPRVGFAWDPFRNGKSAVRGGFGLFDALPLPYQQKQPSNGAPFTLRGTVTNPNLLQGSFFAGAAQFITVKNLTQTAIEYARKRNYVMQWNLNVQRELAPNLTALVGYVGSHGVHQPFSLGDLNSVIPTLTPEGYLFPSPIGTGSRLNPAFGTLTGLLFEGNSYYHSLEVGIRKKMSRGLQVQGSYTWGKSIDTSSATSYGDQFRNSVGTWWNWFDTGLSRGPSDFNIGRTLVINATWEVPGLKSGFGPLRWLANGWELGGIYTASDGVPFTATFGTNGDPLGLRSNDPWDFPDRLTGPGCQSLINPGNPNNYIKTQCFTIPSAKDMTFWTANCDPTPPIGKGGAKVPVPFPQCFNLRGNAGRNILTGPGLSELDFSVFKNNSIKRISETFNVQFRAEFFNILNRANFSEPLTPDATDIFNSSGAPTGAAGLLTSTITTAREIQFALKMIW
jgi:hypothetical protein